MSIDGFTYQTKTNSDRPTLYCYNKKNNLLISESLHSPNQSFKNIITVVMNTYSARSTFSFQCKGPYIVV